MELKFLTLDDYLDNFSFHEQGTACGIEVEPNSKENYFAMQVFLPKSFFNLKHPSLQYHPIVSNYIDNLPNRINIKFELFGIGSIGNEIAYVFKPWSVGIDIPMVCQIIENFHLYVPRILFHNLIERLIYTQDLNKSDFPNIRVLQDIPVNTFQYYGLDIDRITENIETDRLILSRKEQKNSNEIIEFYKINKQQIEEKLQDEYFHPTFNIWFEILNLNSESIGFIRLHYSTLWFTGGLSMEYIIKEDCKKNDYEREIISAILSYLKLNSHVVLISTEINPNDSYLLNILGYLGFFWTTSKSKHINDNFVISLYDTVEKIQADFKDKNVQVGINKIYMQRYMRYFLPL